MGSDSYAKSNKVVHSHYRLARRRKKILLLTVVVVFVYSIPLLFFTHNSNNTNSSLYSREDVVSKLMKHLPQQCHDVVSKFVSCQEKGSKKVTFVCHRKWCDSVVLGGHCEPCSGVGDRTRHLLHLARLASMDKCLPIQLDYYVKGIEFTMPTIYYHDDKDASTIWNELIWHQRSYNVSNRLLQYHDWGVQDNVFVHFTAPLTRQQQRFITETGDGTTNKIGLDTTGCLFHAIFKPDVPLRRDIEFEYERIRFMGNMRQHVIGIHFRTGDTTAFHLQNKDVRSISTHLPSNWKRMKRCAMELADRLYPHERVRFFLATDNPHVKQMVATGEEDENVYMTEVRPHAYLRSNADRNAYLELYILSKMDGLVMNVLPDSYEGTAFRVSTFALLAQEIGFLPHTSILECPL